MSPSSEKSSAPNPAVLVPWVLWFAQTMGLAMIWFLMGRKAPAAPENLTALIGLAPLTVSLAARFLVYPKMTTPVAALPVYIVCLAAAEGAGLLAVLMPGRMSVPVLCLAFAVLALLNPVFTPAPVAEARRR